MILPKSAFRLSWFRTWRLGWYTMTFFSFWGDDSPLPDIRRTDEHELSRCFSDGELGEDALFTLPGDVISLKFVCIKFFGYFFPLLSNYYSKDCFSFFFLLNWLGDGFFLPGLAGCDFSKETADGPFSSSSSSSWPSSAESWLRENWSRRCLLASFRCNFLCF